MNLKIGRDSLLLGLIQILIWNGASSTLVKVKQLVEDNVCVPILTPTTPLPEDYVACAQEVEASKNAVNPDKGKTTDEIIRYYGYSLEIHTVNTTDGYILTLHRITGSPLSPPAKGKPSVYMHHGMGGSSDNWLFQPGDRNLAFKLADAGYDVWLANCRGTTYSLGHTTLDSSKDVVYWDFSWHKIAMYDVPATMDKIIDVSKNKKMFYIGFSMGTTVYFVTLSELPEYNDKIIEGYMLSPVAFNGHSTNALRLLAPTLAWGGKYLLDPVLQGRIDQQYKIPQLFLNYSLGDYCVPTAMRCGICDNVIFGLFGFDAPQMNYTNLPNILTKFPNIISVKTLLHYEQSMNSCKFRQFDYGPGENLLKYRSLVPPEYDLSKITARTYFFHGDMDNLACPKDVNITQSKMLPTTVVENYRVDWNLFNHLDFQMAKDADVLVYNKVLELMNN